LVATIAFAALLFVVSSAQADYAQAPEHFGASDEAEQLLASTAIAVNVNGAGGAEAGSIYVAGQNNRVLRFSHGSEGEPPQFKEAWGWGIGNNAGLPLEEFQRCGPAYAAEPRPAGTFPTCRPTSVIGRGGSGGEQSGNFTELGGVAVDPVTGDVYVLNVPSPVREHHLVEVFTPTGQAIGSGFGDQGRSTPYESPESIAEGPQNFHFYNSEQSGIAVDEAGIVYVTDNDFPGLVGSHTSRVMSFEPMQPGNYEHYVYAGQSHDITTSSAAPFIRIALVGSTDLVTGSGESVREYSASGGSSAICTRKILPQLVGLTANSETGEVFFFAQARHPLLHRLGPCDPTTNEFPETQQLTTDPQTEEMYGLAVNPRLAWSGLRPRGVLYGVDAGAHGTAEPKQLGIGDIFVPAEVQGPVVTSESVLNTTSTGATLQAQIDPRGSATKFRFQYLTNAEYEANEPDDRQSLAVRATGGLFGLSFEDARLGGEASVDLTDHSTEASALATATATATLSAAAGTGNVAGAVGKGTASSGLATITGVTATSGSFLVGQGIVGAGIPSGATISKVEPEGSLERLRISAPVTASVVDDSLSSGAAEVTGLTVKEGAFAVGQRIVGPGIPQGTTIVSVSGGNLTLSAPATAPGTGISLNAGSTVLTSVVAGIGTLESGHSIRGEGIPVGTTITKVDAGEVVISNPATKAGTGIAISDPAPEPLVAGEAIEGPGIAPGTTITAIEEGELTLSLPAEATQPGTQVRAGLRFDASAEEVQRALEALRTIGKGNVKLSGGPGNESGSSPYEIAFTSALGNQDLPQLSVEVSGLTGGPATATVTTLHGGGGGFDHGMAEAPLAAGSLAAGGIASAPISGLAPETEYRFRVVATSECSGVGQSLCEGVGAAETFTTYPMPGTNLPDGRAYELVSPAQKQGGEVFPSSPSTSSCLTECKPPGSTFGGALFPMQSSAGGDELAYEGYPFSSTEGAAVYNSYLSRRTTAGWQTTAMSPRLMASSAQVSYSGSLAEGVITQTAEPQLTEDAPPGYGNLYLQHSGSPTLLQPLLTQALFVAHPPHRVATAWVLKYAGHSPDFSAQYFTVNDALTGPAAYAPEPADPGPTGSNLYEWRAGSLSLVNVLPGNLAVAVGASIASANPETHAVSAGGNRVFWEAGPHLYVREDNRTTREVHDPGTFVTASPDGLEVLLSDGCLYSLTTASCKDLTEVSGHHQGGFLGIAGQSDDLSRIYFVDKAALTGEAEAGTCRTPSSSGGSQADVVEEEEGRVPPGFGCNLYLYEAGVGTRFVATLAARDGEGTPGLDDWATEPGVRTAEASPDGRYLAFGSNVRLTGSDNVGLCEKQLVNNNTERRFVTHTCTQVFLYDSATGQLACPSCNPAGETPLGNSTLRLIDNARKTPWLPQPRYLTNQGRLFFDSTDHLSTRDTNGRVEDVYEAEPGGVGSCIRAAGCVSLISPGTGSVDSNFLAMDESGNNVFFTSRERLVPADTDELIDVYDARVGGGFPEESEVTAAECSGEACQPVASAPQIPSSTTAGFQGSGNVKGEKAKDCPKGKTNQSGKCVKKKANKHKNAKKHKTAKKHGKPKKQQARTSGHNRGGSK
jgi:hypothetical protein